MSFTENEMEALRLHLQTAGFEIQCGLDDEMLGLMASSILEALNIEHE